jgi:hypothetical protein
MSVIYVANTGSDTNLGTITAPLATTAKINALLASGAIALGDQVRFRRGDAFAGVLKPVGYTFAGSYLTISSYGEGARPIIDAYKVLNISGGWTESSAGVWRIDLASEATHEGFNQLATSNIGHLVINGVIYGKRVWSTGELANPWDFYCDNTEYLYVKATGNPTTLATDIKAAPNTTCCPRVSSLILAGMDLCGSGGHGVAGTASDSKVIGNRIRQIGGGNLTGTTRYGNGVQDYLGCLRCLTEYNDISDVYDTAYTMQGEYVEGETGSKWEDVSYRFNRSARCSQNMEFWSQGEAKAGRGWFNCNVESNRCFEAGEGWSSTVRPDRENEAHLITYNLTLSQAGLKIAKNIFHGGRQAAGYMRAKAGVPATGILRQENTVVLAAGAPVARVEGTVTATIEEAYAWATSVSNEEGSQFLVLPNGAPTTGSEVFGQVVSQTGAQQADHNATHSAHDNAAVLAEVASTTAMTALGLANGSADTQTQQSSTGAQYAHIASVAISGEFALSELLLLYECASAGTSTENGGRAMGLMRLRLDAQTTPKAALDVTEIIGFGKETNAIKRTDVYLVITKANAETHEYEAQLWVYLRKSFLSIRTAPLLAYPQGPSYQTPLVAGTGTWQMPNEAKLESALPAGEQIAPSGLGRGHVVFGKFTRETTEAVATAEDKAVVFNGPQFQNATLHSTTENNTRITIPAELEGFMMDLETRIGISANATGSRTLKLRKNGTTVVDADIRPAMASGGTILRLTYRERVKAGDYYEVIGRQESGSTLQIEPISGADVHATVIFSEV